MSQGDTIISSTKTGFQIEGSLTFNTVAQLLDQGRDLIESQSSTSCVINLEQVNRIDSAGISLLIEWKRLSDRRNSTFSLEGMQKQATSLIKTYRLEALF